MIRTLFHKLSLGVIKADSNDTNTYSEPALFEKLTQTEKTITKHIEDINTVLERDYTKDSKEVQDYIKVAEQLELLKTYIELTKGMLTSNSEEEVKLLKEKFTDVSKEFDHVAKKEDLGLLSIWYSITFIEENLLPELKMLFKSCLKKGWDGSYKLVKSEANLAKVQLANFKAGVVLLYYPRTLVPPKDDLFSVEKSSQVWQNLQNSVELKERLPKVVVQLGFLPFFLFFNVSNAILRKSTLSGAPFEVKSYLSLLQDILYFGVRFGKAETEAFRYLINPKLQDLLVPWNIYEHPYFNSLLDLMLPKVGTNTVMYVPRVFPKITKEVILEEYKNKTINKLESGYTVRLEDPECQRITSEMVKDLFLNGEDKVKVRILSPEPLKVRNFIPEDRGDARLTADTLDSDSESKSATEDEQEEAIVIHVHGGGFISMSSASSRVYLLRWVQNLKLVHFSVDYRLAPENKYPDALDDVWQAYLFIVNYAEKILGMKTRKVILAGDSAGGALIMGLMYRLMKYNMSLPHGCFLIYPALLMDDSFCTSSYYRGLDEPVLHYSVMRLCLDSYLTEEFKALEDPYLSPLVADNELVEKLPPIRIIIGSEDPLCDDTYRMLARLKDLKRDAKMVVLNHFSHAFLSNPFYINYGVFTDECCKLIRELVDNKEPAKLCM